MVYAFHYLCFKDLNAICTEYNKESPWWSQLRICISNSPSTIRGFFAALMCRSVTIYLEQKKELTCKKEKKKNKSKTNNNGKIKLLKKNINQSLYYI